MTAKVHHLSCGSMCPFGSRILGGDGGWLEPFGIVCHCLLVETSDALVLVDTGFGTDDARDPHRLGLTFRALLRPRPRLEETAIEQVKALGHDAGDVRHIVATHLDVDHAGGLPDFPDASVHVLTRERDVALDPPLYRRPRYVQAQWSHGPRWATHEAGGDKWFGFESVRVLPGVEPEIALVPLAGHTRGHAGVAVRQGSGWLLHCGDGYFSHAEVASPPSCPPGLKWFQAMMNTDGKARRHNQERLRELAREHGHEVELLCAHDPAELERYRDTAAAG